jgi:hypothetical protein
LSVCLEPGLLSPNLELFVKFSGIPVELNFEPYLGNFTLEIIFSSAVELKLLDQVNKVTMRVFYAI